MWRISGPTPTARWTWKSRLASKALDLEQSGLSYQVALPARLSLPVRPHAQEQEEVYVVVRGSGRMKLDDEIVEVKEWGMVRVPPGTGQPPRAGRGPRDPRLRRAQSRRGSSLSVEGQRTGGLTSARWNQGQRFESSRGALAWKPRPVGGAFVIVGRAPRAAAPRAHNVPRAAIVGIGGGRALVLRVTRQVPQVRRRSSGRWCPYDARG